jgi:hypothetical protein
MARAAVAAALRVALMILVRISITFRLVAEVVAQVAVAVRRVLVVLVLAVRSRFSCTSVRRRHRRRPILWCGRIVCAAIWVVAAVTAAQVVPVAKVAWVLPVVQCRAACLSRSVW